MAKKNESKSPLSNDVRVYLTGLFGEAWTKKYIDYITLDAASYIRVNTNKTTVDAITERLDYDYQISTEPVAGVENALRVTQNMTRASRTLEYITGHYYMQSFSSMLPPVVLQPEPGERVLDLCAAPGSKSTQLAELMQNKGTLILNEIKSDRVGRLIFNVDKMNVTNAGVSNQRGEWLCRYFDHYFDKALVDVPCSGLGILQKKSEISSWWDVKRTERLAEIQYKLLVSAFKMLKTGGELVYSTCTVTVEENEMVIDKFLEKYAAEIIDFDIDIPSNPAITAYNGINLNPQIKKCRRFVPFEIQSEGFFIAKIRKTEDTKAMEQDKAKSRNLTELKLKDLIPHLNGVIDNFGLDPKVFERYRYFRTPKSIFFINKDFDDIDPNYFQRIGMKLGSLDSANQLHLNSLASHLFYNDFTSNKIELDDNYLLKIYLEGGIVKSDFTERGQVHISYRGLPIGTAILNESGLKSRLPRAHRTQDFIIPPVI